MSNRPVRDSIWSVPQGALPWYYGVFGVQVGLGGWVVWLRIGDTSGGWHDSLIPFWQHLAPVAIASASSTIIVIEVIYGIIAAFAWTSEFWIWLRESVRERR